MLIDFTVENYRSIKDPVTLSAIAQPKRIRPETISAHRRTKRDSEIAPAFPVEGHKFELLPVLGIFGANASGKSNVLKALDELTVLMEFGCAEWRSPETLKAFAPFRLGKVSSQSPSAFCLRVALKNGVFVYSTTVTNRQILEEKLEHIPLHLQRKQNRLLFHRLWDAGSNKYTWKNGKDFGNNFLVLQKSLKPHEPFMSMLTQRLQVDLTASLSHWLSTRWPGITLGEEEDNYRYATRGLATTWAELQQHVSGIIRRFDTGIARIEVEVDDPNEKPDDQEYKVYVWHSTEDGEVRWPLEEESIGTQRLFSLAYYIFRAFQWGALMLVDELGSNIHPNITREIVRLFQSAKTNPKRAQLIFTSHDNTLQRRNLLRRDQIWFTQKRQDGSTELYPLTDFKPRNDLAVDKAYLDGLFGAVPILPTEDDFVTLLEVKS